MIRHTAAHCVTLPAIVHAAANFRLLINYSRSTQP